MKLKIDMADGTRRVLRGVEDARAAEGVMKIVLEDRNIILPLTAFTWMEVTDEV